MQWIGAITTLANLSLAAIIGVRLIRLARRTGGPAEAGLAFYFGLTAFLSAALSCGLYTGWADPDLALPSHLEVPLHLAFLITASLGAVGAYVFVWRTFRPDSAAATGAVAVAAIGLLGGVAVIGLTDGFAIQILNGPAYWVHLGFRIAVFPWLGAEALRYWVLQRRRLRLGLAQPVVANRFLLWGVWSWSVFGMGLADPIARLWYVQRSGTTTHWVVEAGLPIVNATVAYTSALGLVAATMLFLAFFPTPAYRRWVETRGAVPSRA